MGFSTHQLPGLTLIADYADGATVYTVASEVGMHHTTLDDQLRCAVSPPVSGARFWPKEFGVGTRGARNSTIYVISEFSFLQGPLRISELFKVLRLSHAECTIGSITGSGEIELPEELKEFQSGERTNCLRPYLCLRRQ